VLPRFLEPQEIEQRTDVVTDLSWMPHLGSAVHHVLVATTDASPFDEARLDQLGDDPLDRPLGDAHVRGNLAEANARVTRDAEQHLRVVRDEGPPL
jgi:hypothetical protein